MNKTLKKILSITLCLMIVLSCGAVGLTAAYAETTITMEGDGTSSDPYQITTYEQLCEFSAFVDESSNHSGACAKLMNDISYSGDSVFHTIDDLNGCFDGQGHSISGLILRNVGDAGGFIAGLYTDGVLKNLVLNNVRISSRCDGDAKIFVWLNSGTIENCILTGTVEVFDQSTEEDDYEYLRGIYVFTDVNEGTIRNCVNMANISRPGDTVCGIAGTNRSIITGCCNYGNFNGKNTAGICYSNNGELSSCVNFGEITGSVKASGIALNAYKNEHITIEPTITDCYNAGKVVCTENSPAAFILENENNECVFSNIYFDSLTSGCTDSYATSKSTYKLKGKGVISTLGFSSLEWTELAYDYPLPTGVYELLNIKNSDYKSGDIVEFGTYPQSEITDITEMTENVDYITLNNKYYAIEPIEWIVLDPKTGLCVSNYALNAMAFDSDSNDYASSDIRTWLTGTFYSDAFTDIEKSAILQNNIVTYKYGSDTDVASTLTDNVFLLSVEGASDTAHFEKDSARLCIPTSYAIANGAYVDIDNGNCRWWLRSPGSFSYYATCVYNDGSINCDGSTVNHDLDCARPALYLNLDSEIFTVTTPQLRVNKDTNGWEVSYNEGMTWRSLGVKATGESGVDGKDGANGTDGLTPFIGEDGNWWIGTKNTGVKAQGIDGKDGTNGADGKDGVGIANIAILDSKDGVDTYKITLTNGNFYTFKVTNGTNGKDGTNGITPQLKVGTDGYWYVSYDNGTSWSSLKVKATGENGTNGTNGKDGTNGTDGKDGTNGTDGKDGTDGVGIESTTINDKGELIIKLTNGNEFNLGKITGKNGTDGKDGENGANGEKGEKGDTGAQGEAGKDGKDGVDGKDAATIVSSHYNEKGELILVMSDGTEINSGNPTRQTFTLFMQRIINFFKSIFAVIKGWF